MNETREGGIAVRSLQEGLHLFAAAGRGWSTSLADDCPVRRRVSVS